MWVNKVCQCLLTERRLSWLQRIACHGVAWPGSRHTSAKKEDHGSFVQPVLVYTIVSPCIHQALAAHLGCRCEHNCYPAGPYALDAHAPPSPKRFYASAMYAIRTLPTNYGDDSQDREYCSQTSRLQSCVVSLHRRRAASSTRGQ